MEAFIALLEILKNPVGAGVTFTGLTAGLIYLILKLAFKNAKLEFEKHIADEMKELEGKIENLRADLHESELKNQSLIFHFLKKK